MRSAALLVHQSGNRLRVRIPTHRKDRTYFSSLREKLETLPQVSEVHVSPLTASVLILHRGSAASVIQAAEKRGLFRVAKSSDTPRPWSQALFQKLDRTSARIRRDTGGQWDLPTIAATGMIGLGLLQIFRNQWLPPAWTLFGDAFVSLSKGGEN